MSQSPIDSTPFRLRGKTRAFQVSLILQHRANPAGYLSVDGRELSTRLVMDGFLTTKLDVVVNWARSNSLFPMPMGLACCTIEMMGFWGPKTDAARFGFEATRMSPRQSDVMIVGGWCSYKMAHAVRRLWDQMPDPKWCVAVGACASTGGMHRCYGVVQGIDNFLPVDVYVPGCPPRPEAILHAMMDLQEQIRNKHSLGLDRSA